MSDNASIAICVACILGFFCVVAICGAVSRDDPPLTAEGLYAEDVLRRLGRLEADLDAEAVTVESSDIDLANVRGGSITLEAGAGMPPGDIELRIPGDEHAVLRFVAGGDIYVRGVLAENDALVVEAFRAWLQMAMRAR